MAWYSSKLHVSRAIHQVQTVTATPTISGQRVQGSKEQDCDDVQRQLRGAGVTTRSGCKWVADISVAQAKKKLKLKHITGNPCMGRLGLARTQTCTHTHIISDFKFLTVNLCWDSQIPSTFQRRDCCSLI